MAYLNDPRENRYDQGCSKNKNVTSWLEEDYRCEDRYRWGAMVIDLCGMEPEEYMKNAFCECMGGGNGGGSDTGTTGSSNTIKITSTVAGTEDKDNSVVILSFPSASEAELVFVCSYDYVEDGETKTKSETLTVPAGSTSAQLPLTYSATKINFLNLGLTEATAIKNTVIVNEDLTYNVTKPNVVMTLKLFTGYYKCSDDINNISFDTCEGGEFTEVNAGDNVQIDYLMSAYTSTSEIEDLIEENNIDDDIEAYRLKAKDLVIAIPDNVSFKDNEILDIVSSQNTMSQWEIVNGVTETYNGVNYVFYHKCDPETFSGINDFESSFSFILEK